MEEGWITIHRKIIKWEWYNEPNTFRLFLHLLLSANHKDQRWRGILVKRGQVIVGRKKLAEELGISERQVRTSMNHLKSTNEVTTKTTSKFTLVTLVNYSVYQDKPKAYRPTKSPKDNQQPTNNRPATDQQPTTNNNDNNINNDNNKQFIPIINKPSAENNTSSDCWEKAIEKVSNRR